MLPEVLGVALADQVLDCLRLCAIVDDDNFVLGPDHVVSVAGTDALCLKGVERVESFMELPYSARRDVDQNPAVGRQLAKVDFLDVLPGTVGTLLLPDDLTANSLIVKQWPKDGSR